VFIDSDCVPERDWLQRLCHAIEDGRCDGVGGAIRPIDGSNSASWAGYFCEFREFMPGGLPTDATHLTPGNVAYRRDVFERAGGFPGGFFPLEDQVFYSRLHAAGARMRFDPSIVVTHAHRSEIGTFLAHQRKIGAADSLVARALERRGAWIAARPLVALTLLPALATYRFARTVAACWKHENHLLLRRPSVFGLCWVGMFAWGLGFARPVRREAAFGRFAVE
jgi:GT2 family glycosyltransferase